MNPLDYSLCRQTVTVYRKDGTRQVLKNVYYQWEDRLYREETGNRWERTFLLIVPGQAQAVFAGDRIYPGIGPEEIRWNSFLPVNTPGLSEADYARLCFWDAVPCHTEAGRR